MNRIISDSSYFLQIQLQNRFYVLSEKNYSAKKLAAPVGRNQCCKINVLQLAD